MCRLCSPHVILDSRRVLVNEFHLVISRHNSETIMMVSNLNSVPSLSLSFHMCFFIFFIMEMTPFWQTNNSTGTTHWYHILLGSKVTSSLSKCIICQVDLVISVIYLLIYTKWDSDRRPISSLRLFCSVFHVFHQSKEYQLTVSWERRTRFYGHSSN